MNFRTLRVPFVFLSAARPLTIVIAAALLLAASTPCSASFVLHNAPNPAVQGQPVTFSAFVGFSGNPVPTGTVTFTEGNALLMTVQLDPTSPGAATFSTSSLSVGVHTITASYSGDSNFGPASASVTETINSSFVSTATVVHSSLNPSAVGQSVRFSAQIIAPSNPTNPIGIVTFYDDSTFLGTAPVVTSGSGEEFVHLATLDPISTLSEGSHPIHASYSGSNIYAGSNSATLSQVVQAASVLPTNTALNSSLNPSVFGQSVTLNIAVTAGSGIPTGSVTIYDDTTLLITLALDGNGQAAFTTSSFSVGIHNLTAGYSGDTNFAASTSAPVSQTVQPPPAAATNTSLTSSINPSAAGQSITLTATVSSDAGTPAGSVDFMENSTVLGTVNLNGGTATFDVSPAVGPHTFIAVYGGNTDFAGSSASLDQVVNAPQPVATTINLDSSANPSSFGQTITITAMVSGSGGIPSGTVDFNWGSSTFTQTLDSSGQATFSTSVLAVGTTKVTVVYSGDSNFAGSTASLDLVVNQAATTIGVTSSPNPSTYGQLVSFTATVSSNGGTPTGTVTFTVGAISATVTIASGQAVFTISNLTVGATSVSAVYSGDNNFLGSTSTSAPPQTVNQATTGTTLKSSLNPSVAGVPVDFTATVTSGNGLVPTGSVQFQDGSSVLGTVALSGGQAKLTVSSLNAGSHTIVAAYSGDANFQASASQFNQNVSSPAPGADLVIAQIASDRKVEPRELLVYFIGVANVGPGAAQGAVVSDALPPGATFAWAFSSRGACTTPAVGQNGTVTCRSTSLSKNAFWVITVAVRVNARAGSTLTNTASVTSSTVDPNPLNNSATAVVKVVNDD